MRINGWFDLAFREVSLSSLSCQVSEIMSGQALPLDHGRMVTVVVRTGGIMK